MLARIAGGLSFLFVLAALPACSTEPVDAEAEGSENEVKVDTRSPQARKQYDANVAFSSSYTPRCKRSADATRPRVLVTGFGRFMSIENNATGRIVSTLVPSAPYPET